MANKYEFDMERIAQLVEDEDMTYKEVKKKLDTEAHPKTIGRHYRKWKEEQKQEKQTNDVKGIIFCEECGKEFEPGEGYTKDFCSKDCFNDFYNGIPIGTKEKAEKAIPRTPPPEADEDLENEAAETYNFAIGPVDEEPSLWGRIKNWFCGLFE